MISLTIQFDTLDDVQRYLEAVNGPKSEVKIDTSTLPELPGKRERKPRSDAGQPRGPYKRSADAPPVVTNLPATAAAPATQTPAETPPAVPVAAAEAPVKEDKQSLPSALTLADVRAAMTGRSTEKNIALLKKFGYAKSSDLPQAKYADFIEACKKGE